MGSPTKWCPSCERHRPTTEFFNNRSKPNGLQDNCKICQNIYTRRSRARREGLPATLTWQDIGDPPENCPFCGVRMVRAIGNGNRGNSPGLDRINPAMGYTKQNCIWLCGSCNRMKDNATADQIYRMADWLYELYRERGIPCETRLRPLK